MFSEMFCDDARKASLIVVVDFFVEVFRTILVPFFVRVGRSGGGGIPGAREGADRVAVGGDLIIT